MVPMDGLFKLAVNGGQKPCRTWRRVWVQQRSTISIDGVFLFCWVHFLVQPAPRAFFRPDPPNRIAAALRALRTNPAMAAGVTKRLTEIHDVVDIFEAWAALGA